MIVSSFEVSFLRSNRLIRWRSYRLQITNLEDQEIEYLVECHTDHHSWAYAIKGVALDTKVGVDWTFQSLFRRVGAGYLEATKFRLGPKRSTIYEIVTRQTDYDTTSLTESWKGYVVLRVPPTRVEGRFLTAPQLSRPARVLLDVSQQDYRERFEGQAFSLKNDEPLMQLPVGDAFSTRSIEITTGKAENEVEAEGLGTLSKLKKFSTKYSTEQTDLVIPAGAMLLADEERVPALLDLLTMIQSREDVKVLNELLDDLDTRVRLRGP
jgi:hypothetical protein